MFKFKVFGALSKCAYKPADCTTNEVFCCSLRCIFHTFFPAWECCMSMGYQVIQAKSVIKGSMKTTRTRRRINLAAFSKTVFKFKISTNRRKESLRKISANLKSLLEWMGKVCSQNKKKKKKRNRGEKVSIVTDKIIKDVVERDGDSTAVGIESQGDRKVREAKISLKLPPWHLCLCPWAEQHYKHPPFLSYLQNWESLGNTIQTVIKWVHYSFCLTTLIQ